MACLLPPNQCENPWSLFTIMSTFIAALGCLLYWSLGESIKKLSKTVYTCIKVPVCFLPLIPGIFHSETFKNCVHIYLSSGLLPTPNPWEISITDFSPLWPHLSKFWPACYPLIPGRIHSETFHHCVHIYQCSGLLPTPWSLGESIQRLSTIVSTFIKGWTETEHLSSLRTETLILLF